MNGRTVLVVEDNPITRRMMRFALESESFRVIEASDGQTALALAADAPPDLVLQDYVLPDMDGIQLLDGLRAIPGMAETPVLVVTGLVSQIDALRRHALEHTTFLPKPIEPSRLLEIIRAVLSGASGAQGEGRRLLVVDDEPLNLKLAALRLRDAGFEVETAGSGEEALEAARRLVPDAILSDVLMPGMDGFVLCRAIRDEPRLAGVPVILLSASYVDPADQKLAFDMGADALLLRTSDLEPAIHALGEAFRRQKDNPQRARAPLAARVAEMTPLHKERVQVQLERQMARNDALVRQGAIQAAALSVVRGLAEALARPRDLASVLGDVLVHCLDATGVSTGLLYLAQPDGGFQLRAQAGLPPEARAEAAACFGHPEVLRRCLDGGVPVALTSGASIGDPGMAAFAKRLGRASALVIPFVVGQERVGVLLLAADAQDFSEGAWLGFARTLAVQFGQTIAVGQSLTRGAASEARYQTVMEQANDAILLLDAHGIVEANRQAEALLGRPRAEMIGRPYEGFLVAEPGPSAPAVFGESTTRVQDQQLRRADGSTVSVDVSASPVRIGEEMIVVLILRDITERRRLEGQLLQSQKMEAVGRLAGGVAHDFNNLLGVITGYSELLGKTLEPQHRGRDKLLEIQKAADRAAALTRQLLAFSRKQVLATKVLDLNHIVGELEKMLRRLIGEDVQLLSRTPAGLWPVRADSGQMEQVIVNLVVNARDAMPRGGTVVVETSNVTVDEAYARSHTEVSPGPYVLLTVSDTGEGMDEATQSRIFEPFFTTKEEGKGTGLGLATVFGIVKQSGGHIRVYSEPGVGSTFKVYLPLAEEEAAAEAAPAASVPLRGTETILLVEDAEALRMMIREILEGAGYGVIECADPADALQKGAPDVTRADLLLTDVIMPRASGPEVARSMREKHPGLKVLFMSGYTSHAMGHHGMLDEGAALLEKPFTTDGLLRSVRSALDAV
jgi:PAS domain S-box-containing protein